MNWNKQTLRAGALAILLAMVLRLIGSGVFGDVLEVFAQPELASFLIYTESGRDTPPATDPTGEPTQPSTTDATEPSDPTEEPTKPTDPLKIPDTAPDLTEADVEFVEINYSCNKDPDVEALLTKTLNWDLTGDEPTVLIIHTHGTEAFTPTADDSYEEDGGEYRTLDDRYNVVSLGDELARLLESGGIKVIHDREYYDYPDYLSAYDNSRSGARDYLAQYPSIKLVIDLHRDAAENPDGSQWSTTATVNGERSAQVMFVVGTDTYYNHPNWQTNLSIALKLNALMEKNHPGVTRQLDLRKQRFNQDLSTGAIIAEIGTAGNTHQEAMNAVSVLAEAILQLAHGSK